MQANFTKFAKIYFHHPNYPRPTAQTPVYPNGYNNVAASDFLFFEVVRGTQNRRRLPETCLVTLGGGSVDKNGRKRSWSSYEVSESDYHR